MKKQSSRKWISLVILLTTALLTVAISSATEAAEISINRDSQDKPLDSEKVTAIIENQDAAQAAYGEFLQKLPLNLDGDYIYPDTFCGAYLNIDTYKLCVALTDCSPKTISEYNDYFSNPFIVEYVKAEYSYNELLKAQKTVEQTWDNVETVGIDQEKNRVRVGVSAAPNVKYSTDNALPVEVYYEEGVVATASELRGGYGLSTSTIGMCGMYGGNDALLLCGHGFSLNDSVIFSGNAIATVVKVQYANNQRYDYAIATINSGANVTTTNKVVNDVNYTTITGKATSLPLTNTILCRYGMESLFATYSVRENNVSVNATKNNVTLLIKGLVSGELVSGDRSDGGDSGGPWYVGHTFYGVTHGHGTSYDYYSPITGVTSQFTLKTT